MTEKTAEATQSSQGTIDSPMALSNALKSMSIPVNPHTNGNANSMALVRPSASDQNVGVVSAVDEQTACEVFRKGNLQFLKKTVVTTTTTTTTTKEETTTIIQQNVGDLDAPINDTPTKGKKYTSFNDTSPRFRIFRNFIPNVK